jgi:hypothetical protein
MKTHKPYPHDVSTWFDLNHLHPQPDTQAFDACYRLYCEVIEAWDAQENEEYIDEAWNALQKKYVEEA